MRPWITVLGLGFLGILFRVLVFWFRVSCLGRDLEGFRAGPELDVGFRAFGFHCGVQSEAR